jgi:fructose 1,6-bisphosphate aldolase/phosphatase
MKVAFSVIKADVGSIGGHTRPSEAMVAAVAERIHAACAGPSRLLIDAFVTHTGDDIALIMSHTHGVGARAVHELAWDCFLTATGIAKTEGLYGAGQDLLVDAPSFPWRPDFPPFPIPGKRRRRGSGRLTGAARGAPPPPCSR